MLITSAFLSKSLYHNNDTSAISDIKATAGIALSFKEVWKRSGLTMMASGAVAALTVITAIVGAVKQYYRELDQSTAMGGLSYYSVFIEWESRGRTQHLKLIPKAKEVKLPQRWVQSVIRHDYSSESVALAPVLKVFIWIVAHCSNGEITTNRMIADSLNVSESTVCVAKNVLQYEYENITKKKVSEWWGDGFRSIGQELAANAWWTDI